MNKVIFVGGPNDGSVPELFEYFKVLKSKDNRKIFREQASYETFTYKLISFYGIAFYVDPTLRAEEIVQKLLSGDSKCSVNTKHLSKLLGCYATCIKV